MSKFPIAIDAEMIGEYPAMAKSGAGYFYDHVLEYRVWCHPENGAPDEHEGEDYYYAFETYEAAQQFSESTQGAEKPLVLIRQLEWVNEPSPKDFVHMKGERIAEWQVDWLINSKRSENSIGEFIRSKKA
jgi:putative acetyltransferase